MIPVLISRSHRCHQFVEVFVLPRVQIQGSTEGYYQEIIKEVQQNSERKIYLVYFCRSGEQACPASSKYVVNHNHIFNNHWATSRRTSPCSAWILLFNYQPGPGLYPFPLLMVQQQVIDSCSGTASARDRYSTQLHSAI